MKHGCQIKADFDAQLQNEISSSEKTLCAIRPPLQALWIKISIILKHTQIHCPVMVCSNKGYVTTVPTYSMQIR